MKSPSCDLVYSGKQFHAKPNLQFFFTGTIPVKRYLKKGKIKLKKFDSLLGIGEFEKGSDATRATIQVRTDLA